MRKSAEDWDGRWPRYDPSRGYMLCKNCWNNAHWRPAYRDANGTTHPKVNICGHDGCGCGCTDPGPKKVKFEGLGQTSIPMDKPLDITPKS